MFTVVISHNQQGQSALKLTTEKRGLARAVALLGKENGLAVTVTEEVQPRVVKFKGVD